MNDGGPAFPTPIAGCNTGGIYPSSQVVEGGGGMSLRDWFAGMALQGMLASSQAMIELAKLTKSPEQLCDTIAKRAYEFADSMLAERAKTK